MSERIHVRTSYGRTKLRTILVDPAATLDDVRQVEPNFFQPQLKGERIRIYRGVLIVRGWRETSDRRKNREVFLYLFDPDYGTLHVPWPADRSLVHQKGAIRQYIDRILGENRMWIGMGIEAAGDWRPPPANLRIVPEPVQPKKHRRGRALTTALQCDTLLLCPNRQPSTASEDAMTTTVDFHKVESMNGHQIAELLGCHYQGDMFPMPHGGIFFNSEQWQKHGYADAVRIDYLPDEKEIIVEYGSIHNDQVGYHLNECGISDPTAMADPLVQIAVCADANFEAADNFTGPYVRRFAYDSPNRRANWKERKIWQAIWGWMTELQGAKE